MVFFYKLNNDKKSLRFVLHRGMQAQQGGEGDNFNAALLVALDNAKKFIIEHVRTPLGGSDPVPRIPLTDNRLATHRELVAEDYANVDESRNITINDAMVASIDALATIYAIDAIKGMNGSTLTDALNVARVARDLSTILPYQTRLTDVGTGSASFVHSSSYIVNSVANIANYQWTALFDTLRGNIDDRVRPTIILEVFTQLIKLSTINEYLTFIGTHPHIVKLVGLITFSSAYHILSERGGFNVFLRGMKQTVYYHFHRVTLTAKRLTFVIGTPVLITSVIAGYKAMGVVPAQVKDLVHGILMDVFQKVIKSQNSLMLMLVKGAVVVFTGVSSGVTTVSTLLKKASEYALTNAETNSLISWLQKTYKKIKP